MTAGPDPVSSRYYVLDSLSPIRVLRRTPILRVRSPSVLCILKNGLISRVRLSDRRRLSSGTQTSPRASTEVETINTTQAFLFIARPIASSLAVCRIACTAHTGPEGLVDTARAPSPASAVGNGQMVIVKSEERRHCADEKPKQDIKSVVAKIEPARARNENRTEERQDSNEQEVQWRSGGLTAHCSNCLVVVGQVLEING